jgi:hypothetical protein
VIDVDRTRAKTVEVDEDRSKPTDRTGDKSAGSIGWNGHRQRSPAQAIDTMIASGIELITNCPTLGLARLFAIDYQRSRGSELGYQRCRRAHSVYAWAAAGCFFKRFLS